MYNGLNSNYYCGTYEQRTILDPNFSSVMITNRQRDPEIEAENARYDAEYGYPEDNDYYPLLEEIVIDNTSISYADEMLGKWEKSNHGFDDASANIYGLFIKQKTETDTGNNTVAPEDAGFEEIEDKDPYYYRYRDSATKEKSSAFKLDKTKLYKEKYGSIFRAFADTTQEEIIEAPLNQMSFVNAGPGTGKTYTLMRKITHMVENLEADPEGILVLCFTNAAVNEIKARIKKFSEEEGDRSFLNIDVRTFHSFSWLLINQANEVFIDRDNYRYIDYTSLDYDQSIAKASEIIYKFGEEVFGNCTHIIVDEIQDLTDVRARMVLHIVDECKKAGIGITVLGDSCQAIYDYSEEEILFELKSDRFYDYMFERFYDSGKFYRLDKNHRQSQDLIRICAPLRETILSGKKEDVHTTIAVISKVVPAITQGLATIKLSNQEFNMLKQDGTVCLMCRNNAQVLATSSNLHKRGIKHVVNAYDEFEQLADWIGKVWGLYPKEIISFDEFEELVRDKELDIDAYEIWSRLQDLIGSQNNVLKIPEVLMAIAKSKVDDPLFRNVPKGNLIVSNIHKAKGREYDTVVLEKKFVNRMINESKTFISPTAYLEEAKMLYVAMTRPRTKLYFNDLAAMNVSLHKIRSGNKRWARGDGSNLVTIEVRAQSDVNPETYDNEYIQEYICNNVSIGDEIRVLLDNTGDYLTYNIFHVSEAGEKLIGEMNVDFIDDIDYIITPYDSPWPRRITDLYVSGIHSKISPDFKHTWCWVDFCGLGKASNDVY
ncbi:Superfamily I DNA and RNA helicases [Butyrivibrio fibrisolvens 16/4]|nr:Superfamily I DNA and RNA helicases [Butyrivibrio fibrisolvens 16/4]